MTSSHYEKMYVIPKGLYEEFLNHKVDKIKEGVTSIHIRQLNNIGDNVKAALQANDVSKASKLTIPSSPTIKVGKVSSIPLPPTSLPPMMTGQDENITMQQQEPTVQSIAKNLSVSSHPTRSDNMSASGEIYLGGAQQQHQFSSSDRTNETPQTNVSLTIPSSTTAATVNTIPVPVTAIVDPSTNINVGQSSDVESNVNIGQSKEASSQNFGQVLKMVSPLNFGRGRKSRSTRLGGLKFSIDPKGQQIKHVAATSRPASVREVSPSSKEETVVNPLDQTHDMVEVNPIPAVAPPSSSIDDVNDPSLLSMGNGQPQHPSRKRNLRTILANNRAIAMAEFQSQLQAKRADNINIENKIIEHEQKRPRSLRNNLFREWQARQNQLLASKRSVLSSPPQEDETVKDIKIMIEEHQKTYPDSKKNHLFPQWIKRYEELYNRLQSALTVAASAKAENAAKQRVLQPLIQAATNADENKEETPTLPSTTTTTSTVNTSVVEVPSFVKDSTTQPSSQFRGAKWHSTHERILLDSNKKFKKRKGSPLPSTSSKKPKGSPLPSTSSVKRPRHNKKNINKKTSSKFRQLPDWMQQVGEKNNNEIEGDITMSNGDDDDDDDMYSVASNESTSVQEETTTPSTPAARWNYHHPPISSSTSSNIVEPRKKRWREMYLSSDDSDGDEIVAKKRRTGDPVPVSWKYQPPPTSIITGKKRKSIFPSPSSVLSKKRKIITDPISDDDDDVVMTPRDSVISDIDASKVLGALDDKKYYTKLKPFDRLKVKRRPIGLSRQLKINKDKQQRKRMTRSQQVKTLVPSIKTSTKFIPKVSDKSKLVKPKRKYVRKIKN